MNHRYELNGVCLRTMFGCFHVFSLTIQRKGQEEGVMYSLFCFLSFSVAFVFSSSFFFGEPSNS